MYGIVLGAVAPTVIRASSAEACFRGRMITDSLIEDAATVAMEEVSPITDIRSTAEYRKKIVKVLVARALKKALERANNGEVN